MDKKISVILFIGLFFFLHSNNAYADKAIIIPLNVTATNTYDLTKARIRKLDDNTIRFTNVIIDNMPYSFDFKNYNSINLINKNALTTFEIPTENINIDGASSDWIAPDTGISEVTTLYHDQENDQEPDNGHIATDIKRVFLARDDTYIYIAFFLYDGTPSGEWPHYTIEFNFFQDELHTAGNTILMASTNAVTVWHRENNCASFSYDFSYVQVGTNFIEYKVPISAVEYDGWGEFDKIGIDGRFIRAYAIHCETDDCQGITTYDGAGEENKNIIYNFYK